MSIRKIPSVTKEQLVKDLNERVKKLQTQLTAVNKASGVDEYINIDIQKTQAHFKRVRNAKGDDYGIGKFFLLVDVTAKKESVYIPLSIASSKKPTGFVYQIEGTAKGSIATANVSARGDGVTHITLGTILYCKIPVGKIATFRIQIEIKGQIGKTYKILISRINYKLNPNDVRYKGFLKEISTDNLKFD